MKSAKRLEQNISKLKVEAHIASDVLEKDSKNTVAAVHKKYNSRLKKYVKYKLKANQNIDTDEVLQEVYLRILKHPRLTELDFSLAFLKKIASNLIIDRFRSMRLRRQEMHYPFDDALLPEDGNVSVEKIIQSREGMAVFNDVFENLSDNCRRAFILSRFKGYTYDEIAEEMNISKSSVNKHISKVLLQLLEIFDTYI